MQEVIEVASKIKDCLAELCNLYCQLPEIIESEHDALKESKYDKVREITRQKNKIGDQIEVQFGKMTQLTERISLRHAAITDSMIQDSKASGMYAVVARLQDIAQLVKPEDIASQVLEHVIQGLEANIKTFELKMMEIQPLIEMNKKVVSTMLNSYRESYRFWQELAEENVSAYSKDGVQKAQGRLSGFAIKA